MRKAYSVPLCKPVTLWDLVAALLPIMSCHTPLQVMLPPDLVPCSYWYLTMLGSLGSSQVSVTWPGPWHPL